MGAFDKIKVPEAFKRRNKFTFRPVTQTTSDWFTLRPVFSVEIPPQSDIRVNQSYYCRLSPLQKPMMGSGRIVNRAFFVPYRVIMPGFDDMIQDVDYTGNYPAIRYSHVPYCYQSQLVDALIAAGGATTVASATDAYDFAYPGSGGQQVWVYYKFTEKGRQIYSILTGLGISLSFTCGTTASHAYDTPVSLMKFLAYCRIVSDWYVNNNFLARARDIQQSIALLGRNVASPQTDITATNITLLMQNVFYSTVDNDYFSTASVNPVTPTGSTAVTLQDVSNDTTGSSGSLVRSVIKSAANASVTSPTTPVIVGGTNSGASPSSNPYTPGNVTQYALSALEALTSYMQRNNIVGHKTLDRFRARWGGQLKIEEMNRSYYLGSNSAPLRIDEVMSNADTTGAALGAYVGRGEAGDRNKPFSFKNESNSFGVFIILSTIIPDIHYGQGISRDNLHINRLDFLTPEFDALGYQAIARAELYNDAKTVGQHESLLTFDPLKSFGLQPTYSDYCRIPDILSGDFRRIGALDLRAFHLFRMFSEHGVEGSPQIQNYSTISENFVTGNPSEYNKIFNYSGTDWDHFYLFHSFDVKMVMPKRRMVDTYEFHDDNSGAPITMSYRGTKLN